MYVMVKTFYLFETVTLHVSQVGVYSLRHAEEETVVIVAIILEIILKFVCLVLI